MIIETYEVLHKILLSLDAVSSYWLKQFLPSWIPVGKILWSFSSTFYIQVEISLLLLVHLSHTIFLTLSQVATFLLMYLDLKSIWICFLSYPHASSATFFLGMVYNFMNSWSFFFWLMLSFVHWFKCKLSTNSSIHEMVWSNW